MSEATRAFAFSLFPKNPQQQTGGGKQGRQGRTTETGLWMPLNSQGHVQCSAPGPHRNTGVNKWPLGTQQPRLLWRSAFLLSNEAAGDEDTCPTPTCGMAGRESAQKLLVCMDSQCFPSCSVSILTEPVLCRAVNSQVTHTNQHMAVGCVANPSRVGSSKICSSSPSGSKKLRTLLLPATQGEKGEEEQRNNRFNSYPPCLPWFIP